jgi:hypothetical protein
MGGTPRPKKWGEYGDWLSPFSRRLYKLPWVTGWKSHSGHGSNIGGKVITSHHPFQLPSARRHSLRKLTGSQH